MFGKLSQSVLILFAMLFIARLAVAQDDSKYAGAFLEIPIGSRALGMGGAFTAVADDASAFHWNPAGVSLLQDKTVGLMYSSEFGTPGSALADLWHFGVTFPMKDVTLSANWVRLSVGDLLHTPDLTTVSVTDERQRLVREIYGGTPDYFSDNEDAVVLSVARNNKFTVDWGWLYYKQQVEVPVGINFKVIHEGVGDFGSASGLGIDAGAMLKFSVAEFLLTPYLGDLALGASATDIFGTKLHWSTQREQTIPMRLFLGAAYTQRLPFKYWTATLVADRETLEPSPPRYGVEVKYRDIVALRAGLNEGTFTAGAGFDWEHKARVDYSLALNSDLGPVHRLSFAIDLDNIWLRAGGAQ